MKQLLKYSGVLLIIIAAILLGLNIFLDKNSNAILVVSGALLVVGLMGYIFTNKLAE
jgi:hypothetical protein